MILTNPYLILTITMASSSSSALHGSILLSQSEKDFIRAGCRDDCRFDGRKRSDFRHYTILTGEPSLPSSSAQPPVLFSNGSARILSCTNGSSSNNLHMLCSVKADVVHPAPDRPDRGVVTLHVDSLTPTTSASQRRAQEHLQETLSHLLVSNDNTLVDTAELCIVPHQYVWRLQIDLYLLAAADAKGALLDASSHVLKAALMNTQLPALTAQPSASTSSSSKPSMDLVVDSDYQKGHAPAACAPYIVTVTLILVSSNTGSRVPQTVLVLDATAEEEACAYAQLHVALVSSDSGKVTVCGVTQSGAGSLPMALLPDCVALAVQALEGLSVAYSQQQQVQTHCLLPDTYALQ
jgi:exosome complex component RRP42